MRLRLPAYVEGPARPGEPYLVRLLFHPDMNERGPRLSQATHRLEAAVRRELEGLRREARLDRLVEFAFRPSLHTHTAPVHLELKKRTLRPRLLLVHFAAARQRLVSAPAVPDFWFEAERGEDLALRAGEALSRHLRTLESLPERLEEGPPGWLSEIEVEVDVPAVPPRRPRLRLAFLGEEGPADGATELRRVGRRLDVVDPEEAEECLLRDREAEQVRLLLEAPERLPVAVVGPRRVGKSALIREVARRVARERTPGVPRARLPVEYWLVSPQRLISGMSYVGQWEGRLLAILRHLRKRGHILVLDDLPGLFLAGRSACSDLTVGDVLKPWLERREVRLLAEATPEALQALRERDRGFADLFAAVPLRETTEDQTLRVALSVVRRVEQRQRCTFQPEALSAALDVHRRYVRDAVFPGKVAGFLAQVGVRHRGLEVDRDRVLSEFGARTGLALRVLDDRVRLDRREVVKELSARVVGQEEAVEAMADAVSVARARLQDPTRPVASLLFVGPTGVGKTECARALAAWLFGSEERLLRFDMNEYVSWDAAARLVGTFDRPEGALTSAVRRRPFCVLLLDEVEKAHPDVLNLLLQVLGDGRLTDALGRTADFRQALVVLTSNLGAREAMRPLGLRADAEGEALTYRKAVEDFFPPELFNRLDRVVSFRRLGPGEIRRIARLLLDRVLGREGLVRRRCVLEVSDDSLDRLAEQGYHPLMGARALKRVVEREVVAPVAERLAVLPGDAPAVVSVLPAAEGLQVEVAPLEPVEERGFCHALGASPADLPPSPLLDGLDRELAELGEALDRSAPAGPLAGDELNEEHLAYFGAREQFRTVASLVRRVREGAGRPGRRTPVLRGAAAMARRRALPRASGAWRDVLRAGDLRTAVRELAADLVAPSDLEADLQELLRELALLRAVVRSPMAGVRLSVRSARGPAEHHAEGLRRRYAEAARLLGLEAAVEPDGTVVLEGPGADVLTEGEAGLHLFDAGVAGLHLVRVEIPGTPPRPRVVRLYGPWNLDLRTGFLAEGEAEAETEAETMRSWWLAGV